MLKNRREFQRRTLAEHVNVQEQHIFSRAWDGADMEYHQMVFAISSLTKEEAEILQASALVAQRPAAMYAIIERWFFWKANVFLETEPRVMFNESHAKADGDQCTLFPVISSSFTLNMRSEVLKVAQIYRMRNQIRVFVPLEIKTLRTSATDHLRKKYEVLLRSYVRSDKHNESMLWSWKVFWRLFYLWRLKLLPCKRVSLLDVKRVIVDGAVTRSGQTICYGLPCTMYWIVRSF